MRNVFSRRDFLKASAAAVLAASAAGVLTGCDGGGSEIPSATIGLGEFEVTMTGNMTITGDEVVGNENANGYLCKPNVRIRYNGAASEIKYNFAGVFAAKIDKTALELTNGKEEIVRITQPVLKGEQISSENAEVVEVGGYNLPSNIAHQLSDVNGLYATADLAVGDYILTSKISSVPVSSDVALNSIPSGKVAISLTVKTLASGLSDKLQPGDIIRIYHFLDTAAEVPELRFVKVLSVTDSDGINVDNAKEPTEDEEKQQSATITVLASPEQAKIITGLENDGVAHVALISRNNDKLADELLAEQDKTLQEIYFPETLIEEEAADAENSDAESEPQETETAESAQSTNETAPSAE